MSPLRHSPSRPGAGAPPAPKVAPSSPSCCFFFRPPQPPLLFLASGRVAIFPGAVAAAASAGAFSHGHVAQPLGPSGQPRRR
eukprot:2730230-Pyramimonas_sp.AAC.1